MCQIEPVVVPSMCCTVVVCTSQNNPLFLPSWHIMDAWTLRFRCSGIWQCLINLKMPALQSFEMAGTTHRGTSQKSWIFSITAVRTSATWLWRFTRTVLFSECCILFVGVSAALHAFASEHTNSTHSCYPWYFVVRQLLHMVRPSQWAAVRYAQNCFNRIAQS
jgi:hypothetical protein